MATNNLLNVLSKCNRLIKNGSRQFTIPFIIFLLPISFSFQILIFSNITQKQQKTTNPILNYLLYFLFLLVFYTCALNSITYSIYHCFYGRPVKLLFSITSIFSSFLPLLATVLLSLPSCFSLGLLAVLGFEIVDVISTRLHSYPYLIGFFVVFPLMLYLKVNWTLAPVIVVVESCWGLEPFNKSVRLMKGMKGVALSQLLIYGFWLCICSHLTRGIYGITYGGWAKGLIIVASACLVATFLLKDIAISTLLYIFCKANHGELEEKLWKNHVGFPFLKEDVSVKKENGE